MKTDCHGSGQVAVRKKNNMPNSNISIKKNFIMNALLTMSSFLFPLITTPYVSSILKPAGTGHVDFATSVIANFSIFAQLGIPTYGIRACAKIRDKREELTRTAHELLMINLIMNVLTYAALAVAIKVVPAYRDERLLLIIMSLTMILTSIGMEWLYKALEQYTYITIRSLIFKVIAVVAMFFLVRNETDYIVYGAITIFAASASNVMNLINAHKYIGFRPVGRYNLRRHLKPVAIFFAMACATTIYTHLDNNMLGLMTTQTDVGYYGAAVKIKTILVTIVTSLGVVLLPRASYYIEQGNMDEFRRITAKALNFVFLLALPLTVFFILFAKEGVLLITSNDYAGTIIPMQVIMPTLFFIGVTNILGIQILVPTGREKIVLYSEIAGAIIDVIINALLIPTMRATGAAIGTLVAEFVVLAVQYCVLRKEIRYAFRQINYWKIAIGILIGTALSIGTIYLGLGNFLTLLISAVLFFGSYGLFLLLTKESLTVELFDQTIAKFKEKIGLK